MGQTIQTVLGPLADTGYLLPHEHIFVDLRGPAAPGYAEADADAVLRLMRPHLEAIQAQGVVGLVECSTVGVGRNVTILQHVARATGFALVAPTGVYHERFAPADVRRQKEAALQAWMRRDIVEGIGDSGVRAGFIKVASSNKRLTALEERVLRAAAHVAQETGVVIASHTVTGRTALRQMAVLAEEGLPLNRFIWVHAHIEPDVAIHQEAAARGVYVEYDHVGAKPQTDDLMLRLVQTMVAAGYVDRLLLSHDAGWYDPAQLGGGQPRGFTALLGQFVPRLQAAGLAEAAETIVRHNPWRAFAPSIP